MSSLEILRKITTKHVIPGAGKGMRDELPKDGTPVQLYKVFGIANGVRSDEGIDGKPWYSLRGNFEAVRNSDGKRFMAPEVFLPEPMASMLYNELKNDNTKSVQFAYEVGVKKNDSNMGFEYTISPLVQPKENDALAQLRQLALSAPQNAVVDSGTGEINDNAAKQEDKKKK